LISSAPLRSLASISPRDLARVRIGDMQPNPYESPRNSQPLWTMPEDLSATAGSARSSDKGILRILGLWICYVNLAMFCVWATVVASYLARGFELLPVLKK